VPPHPRFETGAGGEGNVRCPGKRRGGREQKRESLEQSQSVESLRRGARKEKALAEGETPPTNEKKRMLIREDTQQKGCAIS